MVEPTGHCPYLGLKQNRAIRFASPTSEHRCYVSGEPLDIPVDQANYCLSQGHVHCPLYMGLSLPTTNDLAPSPEAPAQASGGLRGWYASLSPRDRAVYAAMLGMLALIIAIYLFAGLRTFFSGNGGVADERPTSPPAPTSTQQIVAVATAAPTAQVLPTPTDLPDPTPEPQPTDVPPTKVLIPLPASAAALPTTATSNLIDASASPSPATGAGQATSVPAGQATSAPTASPATGAGQATSVPAGQVASAPTAPPAQGSATSAPTITPAATSVTQVAANRQPLTLYFADGTGTLYVPVRRMLPVEGDRMAEAAIGALIEGPRNGLTRLIAPDARLLGMTIADDATALVNFDRPPARDDFGLDSIVLTLTDPQFRGLIRRVQFQVNGDNLGGLRMRPVVNPINPNGLERDVKVTEFLPLYFVSNDGVHHVRLIRMVSKTKQTADATMRALLEGPIGYEYALRRSIPEGTELRSVNKDGSTLWVDLTQSFADSADRDAAVGTVVESLTTLPGITGVRFLVEGRSLANEWGAEYGRLFTQPQINPE